MREPAPEAELAKKSPAAVPEPAPPLAARAKADDGKMTTSLRIEPEKLGALKIIALRERVRVNDLVLQGIDHVIALRRGEAA